jgi:tetratricopeptide (TPR) repeat protein
MAYFRFLFAFWQVRKGPDAIRPQASSLHYEVRYRKGKRMPGRFFAARASRVLALSLALCLHAQTPTKEQFDDLSRRAQAALDSHPQEAIELFKQALAIRPDWPEGWLYMGGTLYQLGRYAEATDAVRKGIALAPIFANGWALLGLSESQLDDPDQALSDIRKGEQLGLGGNVPFETAVRVRAAQLLNRSSAFDEALAQLQPLTKYPNEPGPVEETMGFCALASPDDPAGITPERRAVVDLAGKAAWSFATQHPAAAAAAYRQWRNTPPNPACTTPTACFCRKPTSSRRCRSSRKRSKATPSTGRRCW